MAAQFEYIPSTTDFQSTAEPLIIQVRETTAGPFFKYRFILVIKNRNGDQLAKLKTHPLASDNLSAVFDISRICDDYIGANVVNNNATTGNILTLGRTGYSPGNAIGESSDRNVAAQFTLELGFESATSATADPTETLPQSPAETTTLFAFRDEFQNYGDAYARGDGSFQPTAPTDNFLSSAPNLGRESTLTFGDAFEHRIGIAQASVLAWGMQSSDAEYVIIRGYEADGTIINTATLDIDVVGGDTTPSTDSQAVQFVGIGPANLEDHATAAFNTQLEDIVTDPALAYYEVYLSEFASVLEANQVSAVHRYTIDNGCSKYPRVQLLFLNRHGGWDTFNFDQRSEESVRNIQRSQYNRPRGNWDSVTGLIDWNYNGWERGVTTTAIQAERQVKVSTDYIEEGYADHLRDLALSRSVFIVEGTEVIPCTVTDSEYLFKTTVNEKLITYSFSLQYSNRPRLK